jgi:hypothetical protein
MNPNRTFLRNPEGLANNEFGRIKAPAPNIEVFLIKFRRFIALI